MHSKAIPIIGLQRCKHPHWCAEFGRDM